MFEIRKALLTPGTGLYDNFYFGWIVPLMLTLKRQWNEKALGIKYTLTACNNTAQKMQRLRLNVLWSHCPLFILCNADQRFSTGSRTQIFTMDINWWPTNSPQIVYRAKVNKKSHWLLWFSKMRACHATCPCRPDEFGLPCQNTVFWLNARLLKSTKEPFAFPV